MTAYRLLEHTADMGIAARGNSLAELFQAAAEGLRAVLIEAPCDETESQQVSLTAEEPGELLVAWLQEILYRFECSRITSYNVCYTKLLRHTQASLTGLSSASVRARKTRVF